MRRTCIIAVTCCLLATVARPAAAQQPDAASLKDIHRLLELAGALKMGQQIASTVSAQVIDTITAERGGVPARAVELVNEILDDEFGKAFREGGDVAEGIARVYARHFTPDEIRGLIAFYETPLGRKVTDTLPALAQGSMEVGIEWAEKHMPGIQKRIEEKLRAEGFLRTP